MSDSFDATTIVFALLALFVLFKLKSVLGTRTGNERPPGETITRRPSAENGSDKERGDNVIQLPGSANPGPAGAKESNSWKNLAEEKSWSGLDDIRKADTTFTAPGFIDGSKKAYEMIVSAFASGEKSVLNNLLAPDVYDGFASAITAREERGDKIETVFVSIEGAKIEDAHLKGSVAQITVRLTSKLITATRNRAGEVIDGNPDKVVDIVDIWTFSKDATSRDPNWKLIATELIH